MHFASGDYVIWVWSQAAHGWRAAQTEPDRHEAIDLARKLLDRPHRPRVKVTFHGEQIFPTAGLRGSKHLHDVPRGGKGRRAAGGGLARLVGDLKKLTR